VHCQACNHPPHTHTRTHTHAHARTRTHSKWISPMHLPPPPHTGPSHINHELCLYMMTLHNTASRTQPTGNCAELCAAEMGFTREAQDAYTATSYARAAAATAAGKFDHEIVPVTLPAKRGKAAFVMSVDEECGTRPPVTAAELVCAPPPPHHHHHHHHPSTTPSFAIFLWCSLSVLIFAALRPSWFLHLCFAWWIHAIRLHFPL
jgi:hypothetical protein